ncbi:hypothetical protein FACS189446_8860 [Bacteroidia bacterium]|nr:hypothetical protein FACS189446_8860 [Bacteroidia bacterium]
MGCDLLQNFSIFDIGNSSAWTIVEGYPVVICFKILVSLTSETVRVHRLVAQALL